MNDFFAQDMDFSHLQDVLTIENLSFRTPWSEEAFISELTRNKCARYRVIIGNGRVAAYGGMWVLMDEAHITNIAVHPEYRGIGLGNMIMEDMISCAKNEDVRTMTLEVRTSNTNAISLYRKYGFEEVAIRKGYYQDTGEDAIIMWKYDVQEND